MRLGHKLHFPHFTGNEVFGGMVEAMKQGVRLKGNKSGTRTRFGAESLRTDTLGVSIAFFKASQAIQMTKEAHITNKSNATASDLSQ